MNLNFNYWQALAQVNGLSGLSGRTSSILRNRLADIVSVFYDGKDARLYQIAVNSINRRISLAGAGLSRTAGRVKDAAQQVQTEIINMQREMQSASQVR